MAYASPRTWVAAEVVTAAIMNAHVRDNFLATGGTDGLLSLPWLIDVDVLMTPIAQTNFNTNVVDATCLFAGSKQSSGAQNAEISFDVAPAAGTWTFELMHITASTRGIYSVQFDTVEKGTIDGYAAGGAVNVRSSIAGIVVAATGKVRITLKMATKNASASSYFGTIQHIQLRRTA